MEISVEKLPKSEAKITIALDQNEYLKYTNLAVKKLNQEVKVAGFRPGHIPEDILRQNLGEERFNANLIEVALTQSYYEAISKEKIEVIERPKINIISENPLKYEATVAISPAAKIGDYSKIIIPKEEQKISSKEVEEIKENIQKSSASYKETELAAQSGNRVEIDFEGFDKEGLKLEKTESKNHPLIIGESSLVEDFEKQLIGMKKGQNKEFNITFPKDYHYKPFQKKEVKFKVLMHKIEEVIMPELNEKFIEEYTKERLSKKLTSKEFDQNIEQNLLAEKESNERARRESLLIDELLKIAEIELPEILINQEIEFIKDEKNNRLKYQGINTDKYWQEKFQDEKFVSSLKKQAEKQLTTRLILREIIKQENLKVSQEDLIIEIETIAESYPGDKKEDQEKVKKLYFENEDLKSRTENRLVLKKLFDFFLEKKA